MRKFQPPILVLIVFILAAAGAGPVSAGVPASNPRAMAGISSAPSVGLLNSGLLNLSRFDIHNSLSYSVSSSSFGTRSAGLWLTEIGYRVSDPLRVSVDVGATLNPASDQLFSEKNVFLHRFDLDYRPSDKFQLNLSYVNMPPDAATALGYHNWGYFPGSRPWGSPLSAGH